MKIRNILYLFATLLILWVLLSMVVYGFQKQIIFQADPLPLDHTFHFEMETPFEEHFLETPDGVSLSALYFSAQVPRKGALLYFHGNADNLQRWGQYSTDFTQRGYDVFMIDYRSYGKSGGAAEEAAYYRDAQLAYDWLSEKFPPEEIVLYGRSLGASIASQLATQVKARCLILETPFDNIQHAIETSIPVLYLPWPLSYHFNNDQHIPKVNYPVYIFHGTADLIVPYRSAAPLKPLLKITDQFITIEGGGHKNLGTFIAFQEALNQFLE